MKTLIASLALVLSLSACGGKSAAAADPSRVEIAVTGKGFEPRETTIAAGREVTLVYTRRTDRTCATEVVIDRGDGKEVEHPLPLDQAVEIRVQYAAPREVVYGCAMNKMISGKLIVK